MVQPQLPMHSVTYQNLENTSKYTFEPTVSFYLMEKFEELSHKTKRNAANLNLTATYSFSAKTKLYVAKIPYFAAPLLYFHILFYTKQRFYPFRFSS